MLVFHPIRTTMDIMATMDTTSNHTTSNHTISNRFILPTLYRLLTSITTTLHHFKEQELFHIISQLAPCHTTITHALSPVTTQADMSLCKPHTIKDLDMSLYQDVPELHGLVSSHHQEIHLPPHFHSEIPFMMELDRGLPQMEAAL